MAVDLVTNIIINGKSNGLGVISDQLIALGGIVDQLGGKARDWEKDAIETYKNYETYMLEAEGALTSQYENAKERAQVMQKLDKQAQGWAANSIFHTQDVSKAISEAAHAGWDYEQMLEGIPGAMLLAQAGNLDLSTGLDYIIKALNGTGTAFEDAGEMVDMWAMAANSSATNVGELGEALLKMGATARFADSNAELFTMLGVLADSGTVGSAAGTLLRNSMLRLVAPTKAAADAMEELEVSAEELDELTGDSEALADANALLEKYGFSAYDADGKLKPFLQTYKDLYAAVSGMEEVDQNRVLSAIFPTRTITGAMALLRAAAEDYDGLYEKIQNSDGYAGRVAGIQTSGLMGSQELFLSKWEELARKVGEIVSDPLEDLYTFGGGLADKLGALPPEVLSGLTGLVTAVSLAGPGLTALGLAGKALSLLGPVGGGVLAAALGVGFLVGYANKLDELDFYENFGTLSLDADALAASLPKLETPFDEATAAMQPWVDMVTAANDEFSKLTATLSEQLAIDAITGAKLDETQQQQLIQYGTDMGEAVLDGIAAAEARDTTMIHMLFGNLDDGGELHDDLLTGAQSYYAGMKEEAYKIGQQIREQMVAALEDDTLDENERQAIMSSVDRYNQIMAEINGQIESEAYYTALYAAERVNWDSIAEFIEGQTQEANEYIAQKEATFDSARGSLRNMYETGNISEEDFNAGMANIDDQEAAMRNSVYAQRGEPVRRAMEVAMGDSGMSDAWKFLRDTGFKTGGTLSAEALANYTDDEYLQAVSDQLLEMVDHAGRLKAPFKGFEDNPIVQSILDSIDAANDLSPILLHELDRRRVSAMWSDSEEAPAEVTAAAVVEGGGEAASAAHEEMQAAMDAPLETTADVSGAASAAARAHGEMQAVANASPIYYYARVMGGGGVATPEKYAEGGRATTASIFGEAGPEWAIPEEHSARTAELLNQARAASGFTWADLISASGGLNAEAGHISVPIEYRPTINAGDASGVAQALAADKARLAQVVRDAVRMAMDEARLLSRVEVYA